MDHVTKSFEIKAVSAKGEFEAVIATLGVVDHDGDIIMPGAFGTQDVAILPAHDRRATSLGKAILSEEGGKAIAKGRFNLDTQAGREMHSALMFDLKEGKPVQEWSFGFNIEESGEEISDGVPVRLLKKLDVHEISPVLKGAGIGTGTVSAKEKPAGDGNSLTLADEFKAAGEAVEAAAKRAAEVVDMRIKDQKRSGKKGLGAKARAELESVIGALTVTIATKEMLKALLEPAKDEPSIEEKSMANYLHTQSKIAVL
ncbi:MAG: HK97 family phage prohead protease [Sphingomonadales bacterium]